MHSQRVRIMLYTQTWNCVPYIVRSNGSAPRKSYAIVYAWMKIGEDGGRLIRDGVFADRSRDSVEAAASWATSHCDNITLS